MPRDRGLPTVHEAQLRNHPSPGSSPSSPDPAAKSHRIPFTGYGGSPMMPVFQSPSHSPHGTRVPRPLVLIFMGIGDSDFVHAVVTSEGHEYLALEGRMARKSRAFLVTNYTVGDELRAEGAKRNETWAFYPDDRPLRTLALFGDSRAALAPFLAHKYYGDSYKWLMYGDDDTLFFPHALKRTLQNLDPNIPYFLTDHMWWTEIELDRPDHPRPGTTYHPQPKAPRCVPCNYHMLNPTGNTSALAFKAPPGCPCTPQLLCGADTEQVLSIGLLRAIDLDSFEECVLNTYSTGGDALITICLWEAGYGMTDIDPLWHPDNRTMFDVGKIGQNENDDIRIRTAVVLRTHLLMAAGVCSQDTCQLEWDHTITLHMRSRKFPTRLAHAEVTRVLTGLAAIWRGEPNPFATKSQACPLADTLLPGCQ
ncbi:hypothetical protein WJX73_002056 [Symbiochloris irregularis]|uniref:Hexosyltransferase n=1 Tax=Symbiochloris irregularis TaxID=706552 RepID=A0AAW1P439_9CHLO